MKFVKALGALTVLASAVTAAHAGAKPVFCIYDPLGKGGEGYQAAADYQVAMQKKGYDFDIKSFLDERVAVEDFRTGQCDGVMATALRTRQFNSFTAAMDSVGAATIVRKGKIDFEGSYEVVRRFINTLSSPKAAELTKAGQFEIVGIIPLGMVYPFVNDRSIDTLEKAAGKRVAAFDYDKSQAQLIQRVGARPVAVDVSNFSSMFNNNNVDVIMAPTIVYKPLELYKGIGTKGGIGRFPLTIITYQMVARFDKFPAGFGQASREYVASSIERVITLTKKTDKEIPEKLWIDPSPEDNERYLALMREGRIEMAEKGFYDKKGLKLVKKIRCSVYPDASDCTQPTENW
jgi:TRAP-type C4-dicarboxylate transport system substrate-binding protein